MSNIISTGLPSGEYVSLVVPDSADPSTLPGGQSQFTNVNLGSAADNQMNGDCAAARGSQVTVSNATFGAQGLRFQNPA